MKGTIFAVGTISLFNKVLFADVDFIVVIDKQLLITGKLTATSIDDAVHLKVNFSIHAAGLVFKSTLTLDISIP